MVGATSSEGFLIVTEITPTTSSKFGSEIPLGRFFDACAVWRCIDKKLKCHVYRYTIIPLGDVM